MSYNKKFYLGDYVRVVEIVELMNEKDKSWVNAVNVTGETPLHIAARRRILELFESMLPYYNDIEACDDQGNTVLHQLVDSSVESDEEHKRKRMDLLRKVIGKGANVNKRNKHGSTVVHLAAKHCHMEILEILKEAQADFSLINDDGETALLLACKHMFKLRDTQQEMKIVEFLVNCHCDVNAVDDEGYSALHYAIQWCSGSTVMKLLEAGVDVHLRTKEYEFTALHLAAKRKKTFKIDVLVKAGANVQSKAIDGLTPLHLALLENSTLEVVERLIDYDSEMNCPETILQFTPLHVVLYQKQCDLFQLLIDKGADVNVLGMNDLTPLHLASMMGEVEFVKILIDRGANLNCRDDNGFSPLHFAVGKKCQQISRLMIERKKSLIAKLLSNCKHTPINEDYEATVGLLIDNDVDVNASSNCGKSPLHLALDYNCTQVLLRVLIERGAKLNCKGKRCLYTIIYLNEDNEDTINRLEELHDLPIFQAICSLENVEIRRAVFCVCALVDSRNENGCMSVRYEVENDYERNFECLIKVGADVDDLDVFFKSNFDRSGNAEHVFYDSFSLLPRINQQLPMSNDQSTKLHGIFHSIADFKSLRDKSFYMKCLEEVECLKEYSIDDKVALYNLINMNFRQRRFYMNDLNLAEMKLKFPIYWELILSRHCEATVREVLLDVIHVSFYQLTRLEIPVLCVEEICLNLGIIDMIATVEAADLIHQNK